MINGLKHIVGDKPFFTIYKRTDYVDIVFGHIDDSNKTVEFVGVRLFRDGKAVFANNKCRFSNCISFNRELGNFFTIGYVDDVKCHKEIELTTVDKVYDSLRRRALTKRFKLVVYKIKQFEKDGELKNLDETHYVIQPTGFFEF